MRRLIESIAAAKQTFAAVPRAVGLVWGSDGRLTLALLATSALAGLLPTASVYVTKLLVNAVVAGLISRHTESGGSHTVTVGPLGSIRFTALSWLIVLAGIQVVILLTSSTIQAVRSIAQQRVQSAVTMKMQYMVMEKASSMDVSFFENPASYDIVRRSISDSNRPVMMISTLFSTFQMGVTLCSMLALLLIVSPLLAVLAILSPIPGFIAESRYGQQGYNLAAWMSPVVRRLQYLLSLVTVDTYAKEIRLFGLSAYFIQQYKDRSRALYGSQADLTTRRQVIGLIWSIPTTVATSATYLYVGIQALAGRLTLGDLALYTTAAQSVQGAIQGILGGFASMLEHTLYINDFFTFMGLSERLPVASVPAKMPNRLRGEIVIDHVTFCYPGSTRDALSNVSARILPGETLAIVGANGAGKTTLFKLICRLYDPNEGRILIDGVDIREYAPDALRRQIAVMLQDFVIYQATVAENIGYGDIERINDDQGIRGSARRAGASQLIERLPDGYKTALGKWFERGVSLSGGDGQRIGLARAFMRDASIVLLDEPTASLDAQAEYDLVSRLRALTTGRTTMYISHRFSTVRYADRILVLEDGRVGEQGTHAELISLCGRYATLYRMQASAFDFPMS